MKKLQKTAKLLIGIAMPLLMLLFIVVGVELFSGDEAWLKKEYDRLEINDYTGMSTEDQIRAFMQMVHYMKGSAESMDVTVKVNGEETLMYNESEVSHMVDVRALYKKVMIGKWCAVGIIAAAVVVSLIAFRGKEEKKELLRFAAKALVIAFVGILLFLLALGLWAVLDFNSFWRVFHIVFLDLESSTFDPAVSRMIRICPAELFGDMVMRIFIFGFAIDAALALAAGIYLFVTRKKKAPSQPKLRA